MPRLRSTKRALLLALSTAFSTGLGFYLLVRTANIPDDPIIGEIKLSEHLYVAYMPAIDNSRRAGVRQLSYSPEKNSSHLAVQQLGPKCIPLIQAWLKTAPSPLETKVKIIARKFGLNVGDPGYDEREIACFAAVDLHDHSAPLVPELLALATNKNFATPALPLKALKAIRYKPPHDRTQVITELEKMRKQVIAKDGRATQRERELMECILSWEPLYGLLTNSEWGKMVSAISLSESQMYPHRVLPMLLSDLSSTNPAVLENRAQALGNYGALASNALPILTNLALHPKGYVRKSANNAIIAIKVSLTNDSSLQMRVPPSNPPSLRSPSSLPNRRTRPETRPPPG